MKSPFFLEAKEALRTYLAAKRRYQRIKARAEKRLELAKAEHAASVAAAEQVEVDAWAALLDVPGMSVPTVAVLLQVDETTVSRWAARVVKGGGAR